ncbi:MAG: hypothetical protein ACMG6E_00580 [Candidatus Roizmanbacteria bacterium]
MTDYFIRKSAIVALSVFIIQILPLYLTPTITIPGTTLSLNTQSLSFFKPKSADTAAFTTASDTLSNPRFSYRAGVTTGASGASSVDIDTVDTVNISDITTNHLFPSDQVCFSAAALTGCQAQTLYTVDTIVDSDTFNLRSPLSAALDAADYVIASQSATHIITFTTQTTVPTTGDILITVPAINIDAKTNDGFPDTTATAATSGFDLGGVGTANVSVSSTGCANNWTVAAVTDSDGSTGHLFRIDRNTNSCATGSTISVTIGDSSKKLINPAPSDQHTTQGVAETYSINVKTRDGSDFTLDQSDVLVAPVEGVFVSATIDESLSFTVAAVSANSGSYCGVTRTASSPDSTAYSIPWGTLSTTYLAATHNAQQTLTVTTNARYGYKVYIQESDQMGADGNTCTGTAPSTGNYTFSSGICIRDTVCDGTGCTQTTLRDWGADPSTYPGLGYSLQNVTGTDSKFQYNDSAATFNAKQIADDQGGEDETATSAEIMTSTGTTASSSSYACFRIDVPGDQPAGYYYNTIKYTATPFF